ncbi:hypothetical protein Fmac_032143 [Flemingia macrophylla]|uniref:Uncharacterized protein n=1 Tax=Flemingia macrophylla TaxID=520843 RepID=A0ABD1L436_9FABA
MDVLVGPTFTIPPPCTAAFSSSSSSIGNPDSDDENDDAVSSKRVQNDNEKEEVGHKLKGLASLVSLEDSLPTKSGLSNHFTGKSKSFTDLSQVSSLKELQKQENPFNKRRRLQMVSSRTKSSFYASNNPYSMPLLPLHQHHQQSKYPNTPSPSPSSSSSSHDQVSIGHLQHHTLAPHSYVSRVRHRLLGTLKSRSLSDLKEHDEEDHD